MSGQYVPIQPAASSASSEPGESDVTPPTVTPAYGHRRRQQGRRAGVIVACDACRRKKIRCGGQRPICSSCREAMDRCTYRDEPEQTVAGIVRHLRSLPQHRATQLLNTLNTDHGLARLLLVIGEGNAEMTQRPSDLAAAAGTLGQPSLVSLELTAQNPAAYPLLPPVDVAFTHKDSSDRLTAPRGGSSNLPLDSLPAQQSMMLPGATPEMPQLAATEGLGPPPREEERERPSSLCDARLEHLDIAHWTTIAIGNDLASRAISLYLQTDHPLLGAFDPDLFIDDLVNKRKRHCSSVFLNALLYWACQMYATIDPDAQALASLFRKEAEGLWETERRSDSVLNMATAKFLSLAYIGQGKDHAVLAYLTEASNMGTRMGLFGVEDGESTPSASANQYAAWGVFNWIVFMSLFYRQPGVVCPRYPPQLPIPGDEDTDSGYQSGSAAHDDGGGGGGATLIPSPAPLYMGKTFPQLCRFWVIMHEVVIEYYGDSALPLGLHVDPTFAEFKFRQLLAWAGSLPPSFARHEDNPHHVLILHFWFHSAVLDILRPCILDPKGKKRPLRTFSSRGASIGDVYKASVDQLKRLIITYRLKYKSSAYTILWHTALVYVANAVLQTTEDDWFFYLMLCVYGYEGLRRSWRVTESIAGGILSMALRDGSISSSVARRILEHVQNNSLSRVPQELRATFMVDMDLAMSEPESATAENLAWSFEDNALLRDFTTQFDNRGGAR